jgi:hypothetical protein
MAANLVLSSLDREFTEETSMQKFKRRLKEEPLIPLGMVLSFLSRAQKKKDESSD